MAANEEIPKGMRILYVWQAVRRSSRATPEDVLRTVAMKIGLDAKDKNLKRNIYRDLRELALRGDLNVDYFTPEGVLIDIDNEDSHKNFRAEYYVPGGEGHILGGGLLSKANVKFFPQRKDLVNWVVTRPESGLRPNQFHILIVQNQDISLAISASADERPYKVLIARWTDNPNFTPKMEEIEREFGIRTSVLLLDSKTVSRHVGKEKWGHCILEWKEATTVLVTDLNSKQGTYWADASKGQIDEATSTGIADVTSDIIRGFDQPDPETVREWKHVGKENSRVELPSHIRIGASGIIIT